MTQGDIKSVQGIRDMPKIKWLRMHIRELWKTISIISLDEEPATKEPNKDTESFIGHNDKMLLKLLKSMLPEIKKPKILIYKDFRQCSWRDSNPRPSA